ncbi:hypothetical protein QBC35DRAFT_507938 [Podospora australis]|uniref:Zn(2)-C6 fungal-type domain-containing protein n=1 Tax=Podospora australis TaxID=1536484 RepID=A0AAN7AED2_9PEZI|nr:hypothetical protein QBC35DRAFT_507938 [Podospora australis]
MSEKPVSKAVPPVRKRKAHTKSRRGCNNCKLRHVKCDEAKPLCKNCQTFGVTCTYDRRSTSLQPVAEDVFLLNVSIVTMSLNRQLLTMINDHLLANPDTAKTNKEVFQSPDLAILNRFHERTILSLRTNQVVHLYQRESVRLAIQNPFLFHLIVTTTLMHDRLATGNAHLAPSAEELSHYTTGLSQLQTILSDSENLTRPQKDAIYIATILLAATSFAFIDASLPTESHWPFATTDTDLDWLKLCVGKREMHKLAQIDQSSSSLKPVAREFVLAGPLELFPSDRDALKNFPPEVLGFLRLDDAFGANTNSPYYEAAVCFGRILPLPINSSSLLVCLVLVSGLSNRFREMLEEKNPQALLLLAYYHAKISQYGRWWLWRRATIEGRAICLFLERYYGSIFGQCEKLLEYPKKHCFVDVFDDRVFREEVLV